MMIVSPTPVFRWTDDNGNPAVGWQVETYIAGSSTPVDTYTDATGTAENTNPIILDARGEANIWLDPAISYKYVIKNNLGVVQDTIDQIQAGSGGSGGLTRVYYNDSSSIAFSGLGTLATPLSSSVKLSAYANNALQIRPDGLYAMAIGGGGSVAWGSITGVIGDQADLMTEFGKYIAKDGTTTTTALIPFANGASFGDAPSGLAIQLSGSKWIGSGTSPGVGGASMLFGATSFLIRSNNGTTIEGTSNDIFYTSPSTTGQHLFRAGSTLLYDMNPTNHKWDNGIAGSTAKYQFGAGEINLQLGANVLWGTSGTGPRIVGSANAIRMQANNLNAFQLDTSNFGLFTIGGNEMYRMENTLVHKWNLGISGSSANFQFNGTAHFASTLRIGSIPTGTQVGLVGYDANGNLIQGSGGGGSYVTLSGHNDLTTPWSIGDASTWAGSSAGIQIDPVGSYGLHLKGNTIIEQAVSQALTLYRPVTSGDICLNFDAQDSLGAQANYAQVCGVVVSNTAGAVGGGLDLEVAIAGVLTPLLQLRQAGSTLTGALSVTGALTGTTTTLSGSSATPLTLISSVNGSQTLFRSATTPSGWSVGVTGAASGNFIFFDVLNNRTPLTLRYSDGGLDIAGQTFFSNTTASTSVTTGALVLSGGLGVGGALFGTSATFSGLVSTPASTTSSAGLRIPHGAAPSAPVNGDIWTTTTAVLARINGATKTFSTLEDAQTYSGAKTFTSTSGVVARTFRTTQQTNTPTGTTYTWALGTGQGLGLTLTSSTGAVTVTISGAVADARSIMYVTGHGSATRDLSVTLAGATFIMTGKTSGATMLLDTIPINGQACYQFNWRSATVCYITRMALV